MVAPINTDPIDEMTDKLIHLDALAEAEKVTGKSYKDDEQTGHIGLLLQMQKSAALNKLLVLKDDIHFGSTCNDFIRIITDLGFVKIFEEPFDGAKWNDEPIPHEIFYIYWHPTKAILCDFETYNEKGLNSAKWYFAFKPNSLDAFWAAQFRLSGQLWGVEKDTLRENLVWIGNWDAREAVRLQMKKFDDFGSFVKPWPRPDFLQLNNYMDWKKCENHDYTFAANESIRRFNLLPEDVRIAVGGASR